MVSQLVKAFSIFYEKRSFITVFTTARHMSLPCQSHYIFLKIHFNIILQKLVRNVVTLCALAVALSMLNNFVRVRIATI